MPCPLCKHTKETKVYYVGKSGTLYPYDKYMNWGTGKKRNNLEDLPLDDYPYKIKYEVRKLFKSCEQH